MKKYRTYTLIYGQILPQYDFGSCRIKKMSLKEQRERGFAPIQSEFSEISEHKTYITALPYVDPMKIVSEYVLICEVEEVDSRSALGATIRIADKIASYFTITNTFDFSKKHGRTAGEPYLYQVNKIYELSGDEGKWVENETDLNLKSGFTFLPDRPDSETWRSDQTENFLIEISNFENRTLEKAIKYLYSALTGNFHLRNRAKITLDLFKVIEVILDDLVPYDRKKGHTTMEKRLPVLADKIDLEDEEVSRILDLWEIRNEADVAHATNVDYSSHYPNQFPVPDGPIIGASIGSGSLAKKVLFNFYEHVRRQYSISIEKRIAGSKIEESFGSIINRASNSLYYDTVETDVDVIKAIVLEKFSDKFDIPTEKLLTEYKEECILISIPKDIEPPKVDFEHKRMSIFPFY